MKAVKLRHHADRLLRPFICYRNHGLVSVTKFMKGVVHVDRRRALAWLVRSMRDLQAHSQRLQMNVGSRFGAAPSRFSLLRLFSAMLVLRVASKEVTIW